MRAVVGYIPISDTNLSTVGRQYTRLSAEIIQTAAEAQQIVGEYNAGEVDTSEWRVYALVKTGDESEATPLDVFAESSRRWLALADEREALAVWLTAHDLAGDATPAAVLAGVGRDFLAYATQYGAPKLPLSPPEPGDGADDPRQYSPVGYVVLDPDQVRVNGTTVEWWANPIDAVSQAALYRRVGHPAGLPIRRGNYRAYGLVSLDDRDDPADPGDIVEEPAQAAACPNPSGVAIIDALNAYRAGRAGERDYLAAVLALGQLLGELSAAERLIEASERHAATGKAFGGPVREVTTLDTGDHLIDTGKEWVPFEQYARDAIRRLDLARQALVATGHFTAAEVGDDVAPRIIELHTALAAGGTKPKPEPLIDHDAPPQAHITKTGSWTYRVAIYHGGMVYGPGGYGWTVLGENRARRKASRELSRYLLRERREANPTVVGEAVTR